MPSSQNENPPNADGETPPHSNRREKWSHIPLKDRLNIYLTGGIFAVAALTAYIFLRQANIMQGQLDSMAESGQQTERLLTLNTSQLIQSARTVDKLGQQTTAMSQSAAAAQDLVRQGQKALDTTIVISQLDRRPWVGLQLLQCNGCRTDTDGSLIIGDLSAVLVNTGRTPAIDMVVEWTFESIKASDAIPTYDSIEQQEKASRERALRIPPNLPPEEAAEIARTMALVNRDITPAKEVLAPNTARGITIIAGLKQGRDRTARMEDRNVVYGLGKITYYETSRAMQHTPPSAS